MIKIKAMKAYGKEIEYWYHPYQGENFHIFMDTKNGYLVFREDDSRKWLVKHKHADLIENDSLGDDIV